MSISSAHADMALAATAQRAHLDKTLKDGRLKVVVNDDALGPDLCRGDVVTVASLTDSKLLARGEILFFRCRERTYARRFAGLDGTNAVLRDSVGYEDVVPLSEIMGRAVRCERDGDVVTVRGIRDEAARSFLDRLRAWLTPMR